MATQGLLDGVKSGAAYLASCAQPYIPAVVGHAFRGAWFSAAQSHPVHRDRTASLPEKLSWITYWLQDLKVEKPFDEWIRDPLNQQGVRGVVNESLAGALADLTQRHYDRKAVRSAYECDRGRLGQTVRFVLKQGLEQDRVYDLDTLCNMCVPPSVQVELMRLGTQVLTSSISRAAIYLMTLFKDQCNPGDDLDVRTVSFIEVTQDLKGVWRVVIRVNLVVSKRLQQDKSMGSAADCAEEMPTRFLRLHVNYHLESISVGALKESSLGTDASTLIWDLTQAGPVTIIAHIFRLEGSLSSGDPRVNKKKRLCIEQSIRC